MSSAPEGRALPEGLAARAAALAAAPVAALAAVPGGRNNRLYRLDLADGRRFALKCYLSAAGDRRDRLGVEFAALDLLRRHGVARMPAAIAADAEAGLALYEWIEGTAPGAPGAADIDAALATAGELAALARRLPETAAGEASEACRSETALLGQIERRRARLAAIADPPAALSEILAAPCFEALAARARRIAAPPGPATLSPSDFGFHNAIRRADGRLVFIDFEYFGWDDPVKLTADFVLHPGMALPVELARRFEGGALALFAGDPGFARRLAAQLPLFALRWTLIVLNEFLPEVWARRVFAGARDRAAILEGQVEKARALLRRATLEAERLDSSPWS
ncbi:MAG: aminoglycoside phosphotransferase family protein [Thalassobaculales bacterium]